MVIIAGVLSFLLILICLCGLVASFVHGLRDNGAKWTAASKIFFLLLSGIFAVLLLRPHEEAFQGLDESAFRLMAHSIEHGRSLKGIDETLKAVPLELRKCFLYRSVEVEPRMTRDQSFQIESLDSCKTKPFYYPLLPLVMVGFDHLIPGVAKDYLIPLVGLLFCLICIVVGISYGSWVGGMIASVFLLGSPLPVWLFRGCFPESMGGVLIALSAMSWIIQKPRELFVQSCIFMALGLAISFHLAFVVLAVPLAGIILLEAGDRFWKSIVYSIAFMVGLLPVIFLTVFVTTPYGDFSWSHIKYSIDNSASIRSTVVCAGILVVAIFGAIAGRGFLMRKIINLSERRFASSVLSVVVSFVPILLAVVLWSEGKLVQRGIKELIEGWRLLFGLVVLFSCTYVFLSKYTGRGKIALAAVFLSFPVFFYLKGADQVGLWSQRRLLPSFLCIISCCVPAVAAFLNRIKNEEMFKRWFSLVIIILCVAGLSNAICWPAPYLVRSEYGADVWVEKLRTKFENKLVIFDYHPYSIPFAVEGKGRFLGIGPDGSKELAGIFKWLTDKSTKNEVLLVSAYENPGLEDGCILDEINQESIVLDRVRSKAALPAILKKKVVNIKVLQMRPVVSGVPLVMDKVFDGGPLGLREPWGRKDKTIKCSDGRELPACWSVLRSGIIGPVPVPGETIRITLEAAACRKDELNYQTLQFAPPWEGEVLSLVVSNGYTKISSTLRRPVNQVDNGQRTGIYRIYTPTPYLPGNVGIRGFGYRLGALIHRIRIEVVPANSSARTSQGSVK